MRQYIRHPTDIPLEYHLADEPENGTPHPRDISAGGISFSTSKRLRPGQRLNIHIEVNGSPFNIDGKVVWCHPQDDNYLVGVSFQTSEEAFAVRMVEQICHIEQYREAVMRQEHRHLTTEEAAREWIKHHARDFPSWEEGFY